jgi:hypothetical protein
MRSSSSSWALLALLFPCAFAEPLFTVPTAGASFPAGTITVKWTDGGNAPSISDLNAYELLLYAGSNSKPFQLAGLKAGMFSDGNAISTTISPTAGGPGPDNS